VRARCRLKELSIAGEGVGVPKKAKPSE
jgi:hypothetical protein